jgi:glycosyltransferase involved in cell wall biosynthesis
VAVADTGPRRVRALFVNEDIGGHATVHHHLRAVAAQREDLALRVVDVPPPGFWRKVAGVALPGLARVDADLRAARYQLAQSAWVARQLPRWLAQEPVDVVHFYTHNTALLARRAVRGVPYVVTLDSTTAQSNLLHPARSATRFTGLSTRVTFPFERAVYAGATTVVANSRWTAASLTGDYGIDPARVQVLPMGVPVPPLPVRADGGDRLPRVLFIGRGMARKGGTQLLEVHQRWLADRCELVLVTQDPVPPGRNVTVVDDVRPGDGRIGELLDGTDLMVLPSRIDQWPNAVMEAMSHGVPPVVSGVGGLPEMVADGAGVVLADDTDETLRDTLAELLDHPARRTTIGARARRRVEEDLDVQKTANRLLDVVRDATGSPRDRAGART